MKNILKILILIPILFVAGFSCQNLTFQANNSKEEFKAASSMTVQGGPFSGFNFVVNVPSAGWGTASFPIPTSTFSHIEGEETLIYYGNFTSSENATSSISNDNFRQPVAKMMALNIPLTDKVLSDIHSLPSAKVISSDMVSGHIDEVVCFSQPTKYCSRYIDVDGTKTIIFTDWTDYKLYNAFTFKFPGEKGVRFQR